MFFMALYFDSSVCASYRAALQIKEKRFAGQFHISVTGITLVKLSMERHLLMLTVIVNMEIEERKKKKV